MWASVKVFLNKKNKNNHSCVLFLEYWLDRWDENYLHHTYKSQHQTKFHQNLLWTLWDMWHRFRFFASLWSQAMVKVAWTSIKKYKFSITGLYTCIFMPMFKPNWFVQVQHNWFVHLHIHANVWTKLVCTHAHSCQCCRFFDAVSKAAVVSLDINLALK